MGYEGTIPHSPPERLTKIAHRALELLPEGTRMIMHDATDYMLEQVKVNTPVSHDPGVPGYSWTPGGDGIHLREEIRRTPIEEADGVYETQVGSDKSYVRYVEDGTGLYGPKHAKYLIEPISPGGLLRFPWHGDIVYRSHVWHPGSPGQHMFLYGGQLTEMSMRELTARGLEFIRAGMA